MSLIKAGTRAPRVVLINILVFTVLIAIAEGGLYVYRLLNTKYQGAEFASCLDRSQVPQFRPGCNGINALGARGKEAETYIPTKTHSPRRALILGESVAFGWGADYDATWSEDLNAGPQQAGRLFLNFGVPSTTISDASTYYSRLSPRIPHDDVLIFTGWNDLHTAVADQRLKELFRYSNIARKSYDLILRKLGIYTISRPDISVLSNYRETYDALVKQVSAAGKTVYIMTLPSYLEQDFSSSDFNLQIAGNLSTFASLEAIRSGFHTINDSIREIASSNPGVCLVDLDRAFEGYPNKKSLFIGEVVHMNATGQKWIADTFDRAATTCAK